MSSKSICKIELQIKTLVKKDLPVILALSLGQPEAAANLRIMAIYIFFYISFQMHLREQAMTMV